MTRKVSISGAYVFGMAAGIGLAGPLASILARYWLFAL